MQADPPPPRPPTRKRRPAPTRTNTLLIVLPPLLLTEPSSSQLLPLFQAHFASYGNLLSWTPLLKLGRVVAVYEDDDGAGEAKGEMDGFVWEEEDERGDEPPHPLRVFYGPRFTISHITRLPSSHSTHTSTAQGGGIHESVLLTVPSSGKNFLISPPGSPPVGWEQTEEEEPNREVFHPEDGINPVEVEVKSGTFSEGWADELTRALRFLSVDAGGDEDEDGGTAAPSPPEDGGEEQERQTTQLVLPPLPPLSSTSLPARPAVTVSSPPPSHSSTPPPPQSRGRDITQVKATLESMLGRKRSMSDLRRQKGHSRSGSASLGEDLAGATPAAGLGMGAGL